MIVRLGNDISQRKSNPVPFAVDDVMDIERSETRKLLDTAEKAARRLRKAEAFWR